MDPRAPEEDPLRRSPAPGRGRPGRRAGRRLRDGGKSSDAASGSDADGRGGDDGGRLHVRRRKPPLPPQGRQATTTSTSPTLTTKVKWSTFPPSGGAPLRPLGDLGLLHAAVNPRQVVHNEEHGGVVIWWGPNVSRATDRRAADFYDESPNGDVRHADRRPRATRSRSPPGRATRPRYYRERLLRRSASSRSCPHFDEKAFTAFRDAFRGHGPEGVPLAPTHGTGLGAAVGLSCSAPGWRNW